MTVTAGHAAWRGGGLAIALLLALGPPALAQIQQNPDMPPPSSEQPPARPPGSADSAGGQTGQGPGVCLGNSDRYRYALIGGDCERDGLDRIHQHNNGDGHHKGN